MTKEEILKAIRVCARKLKRNPTKNELRAMAGISERALYTRLGSLRQALLAAGLEASGAGFSETEETLLLDWAMVAKKLRKIPSVMEYQRAGRFSGTPFQKRYGSWTQVPRAFQGFARKKKLERKWREVLKMVAHLDEGTAVPQDSFCPGKSACATYLDSFCPGKSSCATYLAGDGAGSSRMAHGVGATKEAVVLRGKNGCTGNADRRGRKGRRGLLPGRPVYGAFLGLPELAYAPTNEMGVMFLFALMARRLGFVVQRLQMGFPDCEAMREMRSGQYQRVWIEFEFESRNFIKHRHRKDGCDVVVCWRHNWKECPLEVIELSKQLSQLTSPRKHGGNGEQ